MKKMTEYASINFTDYIVFESDNKGSFQRMAIWVPLFTFKSVDDRALDPNEKVLQLTQNWKSNACKLLFKVIIFRPQRRI